MDRNEVFYDWLRAKFFATEDNDDRVNQLLEAVKELATYLEKKPQEARCYTLVALDANIPVDNPRIVTTYEIVKKHWASVEGKYPEAPRQLLRGIMLSALYQLGMGNDSLCRIIYYTASSYSQFVSFGGEQPIINRLLTEFGADVESEATEQWVLAKAPVAPEFAPFKLKDFKLASASVDSTSLTTALAEAVNATSATGHGMQHGASHWAPPFSKAASEGITKAIESAVDGFGGSLSTVALQNEINKYFKGVSESLAVAFAGSFQSLKAVEQRSKLLWWKETLYSTTLGKGYREIDAAVLPVVMALDLAELLPDVTPVSVDYLLTDTYRAVKGEAPAKQPLPTLLAAFEEEEAQKLLAPHLAPMTDCGERMTLTAFLAQVLHDQKTMKKLATYTGLGTNVEASPEQLAVLVLHDLLTERLIQRNNVA